MQSNLTSEQILSLAIDKFAIRTARSWASQDKWETLGQVNGVAWGHFKANSKTPVEAIASLTQPLFSCTCASQKRPCSHAISLRLLYFDQPDVFTEQSTDSVSAWHDSLEPLAPFDPALLPVDVATSTHGNDLSIHPQPSSPNIERPPSQSLLDQQESDANRLATIRAGLDELDLWLRDLIRNGMATLRTRGKTEWLRVAQRLVDAQVGELAPLVQRLATLPESAPDWPERLLAQVGKLHLLVEGFRNFEQLSPEVQGDLRMAVGWIPRVDPEPTRLVHDSWHILSREIEQSGKQRRQKIWLWGEASNRPALIVRTLHSQQKNVWEFPPGLVIEGTCCYYPSQAPLRAELLQQERVRQPEEPALGYQSLDATTQQVSESLAKNPWQTHFPLLLPAAQVHKERDDWLLYDASGCRLTLPAKFEFGWHLRALDAGEGVPLFGIWDRTVFTPCTAWQQRWLSLHILKGQP